MNLEQRPKQPNHFLGRKMCCSRGLRNSAALGSTGEKMKLYAGELNNFSGTKILRLAAGRMTKEKSTLAPARFPSKTHEWRGDQ
jgi:hypothetical protein